MGHESNADSKVWKVCLVLTKSRFLALYFSTWQEAEFIKNEAEEEINPSAFPLNVFLTILCPSDGPSSDKPPPVSQACMPDLSSSEHMTLFDPHCHCQWHPFAVSHCR